MGNTCVKLILFNTIRRSSADSSMPESKAFWNAVSVPKIMNAMNVANTVRNRRIFLRVRFFSTR